MRLVTLGCGDQLRCTTILAGALICLLRITTVSAHHSFAAFDHAKEFELTGMVKDWQWTNPHTIHVVTAHDASGANIDYTFEGYSPAVWRQNNLFRDTVHIGDQITMKYFPYKDGKPGGQISDVLFVNGKHIELPEGRAK